MGCFKEISIHIDNGDLDPIETGAFMAGELKDCPHKAHTEIMPELTGEKCPLCDGKFLEA